MGGLSDSEGGVVFGQGIVGDSQGIGLVEGESGSGVAIEQVGVDGAGNGGEIEAGLVVVEAVVFQVKLFNLGDVDGGG